MERRRRGQQQQHVDMPSIDRLSALPDRIIHHILSFLPTKLSVSTSVLSKRWRFLWAHVPSLDFDSRSHHSMTPQSDIISNFMSVQYKAQNLNTFHLCYGYELRQHREKEQVVVEPWIASAISRNVRVLHLRLRHELPQCLFNCETLVDLKLDCCKVFTPAQVSWPSLKKLHLYRSECRNFDEDITHLLCGCPVLEDLIIRSHNLTTKDDDRSKSDISWPQTKRLIKMYFMFDGVGVDHRLKMDRYLRIKGFDNSGVTISRKNSLIEANIYLCEYAHREYVDEQQMEKWMPPSRIAPPVEFLDCLSNNVKYLNLSGFYHERIFGIVDSGTTIKFDNLTRLEIRMDGADCGFIVKLLELADNLEVLIVDAKRITNWIEPKQVPACLLLHLSCIRIEQVTFTEYEFYMVRYLLKNAQVLERMEISPQCDKFDFESNSDALKSISLFERGSKACHLAFC